MQPLDNKFFESYKRLDNCCRDIYASQNGIGAYLDHMEEVSVQGRRLVPGWDAEYKKLKHLRWVRNQIVHDDGSVQICEPEEIDDVQDFYENLLHEEDPLSQLRRELQYQETTREPRVAQQPSVNRRATSSGRFTERPPKRKMTAGLFFSVLISALIIVLVVILCLRVMTGM